MNDDRPLVGSTVLAGLAPVVVVAITPMLIGLMAVVVVAIVPVSAPTPLIGSYWSCQSHHCKSSGRAYLTRIRDG